MDLFLLHWPLAFKRAGKNKSERDAAGKMLIDADAMRHGFVDVWKQMEQLYAEKRVRAIGVSNFNTHRLQALLTHASVRVRPMVNQVELHPFLPQNKLFSFCKQHDVLLVAYSPLGSANNVLLRQSAANKPSLLECAVIRDLAKSEQLTAGQLLINWAMQRGTGVIPRTKTVSRLAENFTCKRLSEATMAAIGDIHKTTACRYLDPVEMFGIDCFEEE